MHVSFYKLLNGGFSDKTAAKKSESLPHRTHKPVNRIGKQSARKKSGKGQSQYLTRKTRLAYHVGK
jgi:hypothetical protein